MRVEMAKNKIKMADIPIIDRVFEMESGWVLNFVDKSFAEFFREEFGIDIDDPRYSQEGGSKAKRLRYFLRTADDATVGKALLALWQYRETTASVQNYGQISVEVLNTFFKILIRFGVLPPKQQGGESTKNALPTIDLNIASKLKEQHIEISRLAPQPRGYAFEGFLKSMFDAYGLSGRDQFRLYGEQIDGSFVYAGQTYLLEAKWTKNSVDAAALRSFNAKVEDKAAWSRGLFVSDSGFTQEALVAFGRGKRVICIDGLDLHEILDRQLDFGEVIARKVRRAAETGLPYVPVRDLGF